MTPDQELRASIEEYCKRYARGFKVAALDDLVVFVRASIAGCPHPGMCEPGNRSRRCFCECPMCAPGLADAVATEPRTTEDLPPPETHRPDTTARECPHAVSIPTGCPSGQRWCCECGGVSSTVPGGKWALPRRARQDGSP